MPAAQAIPPHFRVAEKIARLARGRGTFSHSILVHGPAGAGHRRVARAFGRSVFCETGEGAFGACGACRNCRRVSEGTHPDWIWIEPDRESKGLPNISIEMLRNLQDRLVLEPYEGGRVVGCLFEAEKMRPEAANSLLKLLEEPPRHALFLLVTESRERILPTIRSRCLHVPLSPPNPMDAAADSDAETPEEAEQDAIWALAEGLDPGGSDLEEVRRLRREAVRLLESAATEGEYAFIPELKKLKLDREAMGKLVAYWREALRDVLVLLSGGEERLIHPSLQEDLVRLGKPLTPHAIAELIDLSFDHEEAIAGYANAVNAQAVFLSRVSEKAGR